MTTPSPSLEAARSISADRASPPSTTPRSSDWRCTECRKLLGVGRDGRLHLRFARGHEYFVGFPVTATCRGCGTLNRATAPAR